MQIWKFAKTDSEMLTAICVRKISYFFYCSFVLFNQAKKQFVDGFSANLLGTLSQKIIRNPKTRGHILDILKCSMGLYM